MIDEERLTKAMTYLAQTDEQAAELKADVDRSEYKAKVMKATVFLHFEGTVSDREAQALKDTAVMEAYMAHFQAIRDYQAVANKRALEVLVCEVWRSINANRRVGNI